MKARAAILALLAAALAAAQPRFDLFAVTPTPTGRACSPTLSADAGRVDIDCASLTALIGYAFRVAPARVSGGGPERFDLAANLPQGSSQDRIPQLVRTLLEERFKVAVHFSESTQSVYALVQVGNRISLGPGNTTTLPPITEMSFSGDVLTREEPNADGTGFVTLIVSPSIGTARWTEGENGSHRLDAANISMEGLADLLDRIAPLEYPVIDQTGLTGRYRVVLEVSAPVSAAPVSAESIEQRGLGPFNAALRNLGLQLERRSAPIKTVIVDHVLSTN